MKARLVRPGPGRLVSSGFPKRPARTPFFVVVCRRCAASFSSSARSAAPDDDAFSSRVPFASSLKPFASPPPSTPTPTPASSSYVSPFPLPPRSLPLLYGKTAVVTGGSRGIGWAIAARLALEGVSCTLIGRDEAVLERAVRALPRPLPPQAGPLKVPLVAGMPTGYVPGVATAVAAATAAGAQSDAAEGGAASAGTGQAASQQPISPIEHRFLVGDVRDEALWREVFAWEDASDEKAAAAAAAAAEEEAQAAEAAAAAAKAEAKENKTARMAQMAQLAEDAAAELASGGGEKLQALLSGWAEEEEANTARVQETARAAARAKRQARKHTSDVHFLINAAGVTHTRPLARLSPDEIRTVLDTNLLGTTLGCAFAMRAWVRRKQRNRCIINIASLLATQGGAGASVYAASKAGVIGLTRGLAAEGAGPRRLIRANVILPGYIQTDMLDFLTGERLEATKKKIPANRLGSAFEVADAALFLAKNDYANNCVLNLDGGLSATL